MPMDVSDLQRRGLMYVLSSPSGAGKTTITRALLKQNDNLTISVSATTRPKRAGEVDGKDYIFCTINQFNEMIEKGDMLEHAKVFGNYYGTPRSAVEKALQQGKDVIFDIDWQGTQQLREMASDDLVTLFVLPPSAKEIENRLRTRSKETLETETQIKDRMSKLNDEITHFSEYDYVLINRDIEKAIAQAQMILDAERLKRRRLIGLTDFVKGIKDGC